MDDRRLFGPMAARDYLCGKAGKDKIGRNQWYRLIRAGAIPHVRLGRRIYIAKAALDRVLEQIAAGEWNIEYEVSAG